MSKCPYCLSELVKENISYWIRKDSDYEQMEFENPVLRKICSEKEKQGDVRYRRFWEKENSAIAQMWHGRIVVNAAEATEISANVRCFGNTGGESSGNFLPYYSISEDGMEPVAEVIPVCSECHNVIRQDFFVMPSFHIGMIAPKETGKTSFLCGMYKELGELYHEEQRNNCILGHEFSFDFIQKDEPVCREFQEQLNERYLKGKSIKGSENIRRFPISVTVKQENGDGSINRFRLFFHDVSGELYHTPKAFIKHRIAEMDALMFMTELYDSKFESSNQEDIWEKYVANVKVYSMEEQRKLQSGESNKEQYVRDLLPHMQEEMMSNNEELFRGITEGNFIMNMQEISRMPVSFVITKGDRIDHVSKNKINIRIGKGEKLSDFFRKPCEDGESLQEKQFYVKRFLEKSAPQVYHFSQKFENKGYGMVSAYGKEPDGKMPGPWGIRETLVMLLDQILYEVFE